MRIISKYVLCAIFFSLVLACAKAVKNPQPVSRLDIALDGLSLFNPPVGITLKVTNSNPFDIVIQHLKYEIMVEGNYLAGGESNQEVRIPKNSSQTIKAPVNFDLNAVPIGIQALLLKGGVRYQAKGTYLLSTNYEGEFNVTKELDKLLGK